MKIPQKSGINHEIWQRFSAAFDVQDAARITSGIAACGTNEQLGYRTAGSAGEKQAAAYLYEEFQKAGLQNVKKEEVRADTWSFEKAELTYCGSDGQEKKIILGGYATQFCAEGETLELVYVGQGRECDYEGLDVSGKLVLIDINQFEDWWISFPAYEAKLHQAKAVLAADRGGYGEFAADALVAQNVGGPADAPAFSICRQDADFLIEQLNLSATRSLQVCLDIRSIVRKDGVVYNVSGEIPGVNEEEKIFLFGHYDGYFHAFHDNASGVALALSIAKGLIKANYRPQKTLVLIAHGAEEWGLTNSHYDWAIGAYQQVCHHPEWQEGGFAAINLESGVCRSGEDFHFIRTVYELKKLVADYVQAFGSTPFTQGIQVGAPVTVWTEDFSYSQAGIPALVNSLSNRDYDESTYHTNYDTIEDKYSETLFTFSYHFYGGLLLYFDQLAVKPLDFAENFSAMRQTLNTKKGPLLYGLAAGELTLDLAAVLLAAEQVSKQLYERSQQFQCKKNENSSKIHHINKELGRIYRKIRRNFLCLDWEEEVLFVHEFHQRHIEHIAAAIQAVKENQWAEALQLVEAVDLNRYAASFSRRTYDFFRDQVLEQPAERLAWGAGLIPDNEDLFAVTRELARLAAEHDSEEPVSKEPVSEVKDRLTAGLRQALEHQITLQVAILQKETQDVKAVTGEMKLLLEELSQ